MDVQQPSSALDRLASGSSPRYDPWPELAEERDRIARDLHDIVIQRLFLVGLRLARSVGQHPEDDELNEILDDIDRSIIDLRAVVYGLRRPRAIIGVGSRDGGRSSLGSCDGDGSVAGDGSSGADNLDSRIGDIGGVGFDLLRHVVSDLADLIGHEPALEIAGDLDSVDDEILTECGVVVRELLINALKHANSTQTGVAVIVDDGMLTVVVEDDGDGVRTLHPAQGGTGLRSLSERARRNGGSFAVEPRRPQGTRVRWSIPITS